MQRTIAIVALALAAGSAGAQTTAAGPRAAASQLAAAGPALGAVLQEQLTRAAPAAGASGQPAGAPTVTATFKPLPAGAYRFEDGEYRSGVSGLTMKLPQLRDEKVVSVREAVVIAHGSEVVTSHVMFVPGAEGTRLERSGPVSAVVVTHLDPARPHDRESVLRSWEPRTPQQRQQLEARGWEFHRIATGTGEGLERVVPNRIADDNFPYRTHTEEGVRNLQSVGVTRWLVSGDRALLEFSQVFPCRELAGDACKQAALRASDRFVQGVSGFVSVRPTAPASASRPAAAASSRK